MKTLSQLNYTIPILTAFLWLTASSAYAQIDVNDCSEPNDPLFSQQWGLDKIDAPIAWSFSPGSRDIVVAVIDTGIDYHHEDLAANMWRNPGETGVDSQGHDKASNGIDDDENGYVDDVHGIDAEDNDGDPLFAISSHGTRMSGIIGAVGDNGIGVTGVCQQVSIMMLKMNGTGLTRLNCAMECFRYVIMMKQRGVNIRVINNSYTLPNISEDDIVPLRDLVETASSLDMLITWLHLNTFPFPGRPDTESLITVTMTTMDSAGEEVFGSWATGLMLTDLAAPGGLSPNEEYRSMMTTDIGGGYEYASRGSAGVAFASGAAALLCSIDPGASAASIKAALLDTVDLIPSLPDLVSTGGRLNVGRAALMLVAPEAPSVVLDASPTGSGFSLAPGQWIDQTHGIPLEAMPQINFSKPMNRASVEFGFSTSQDISGSFGWSNADRTVTWHPDNPWEAEGDLTFCLSGDVIDANGTPLDGNANQISEGSPVDDHIWTVEEVKPLGLIARWTLDEIEGDIAYDSAEDNDAVVIGDALWQPDSGQIEGAIQLDGLDSFVKAPHVLNPKDSVFSIFAWVKGGIPGQVIASQEGGADWLVTDPQGCLLTALVSGGRTPGKPLLSDMIVTDGNWHRIGLVWDREYRSLYIGDELVATDTNPQNNLPSGEGDLFIGAAHDRHSSTFWSGLIDDVRIYDRVVEP